MSISAIGFLAVYAIGLFLTFRHPIYGLLTYLFEWHNHPPYMWWGDELPDLRWSMTIAAVTLISFLINRKKLHFDTKPVKGPIIWLLLIVLNSLTVTELFAILPEESWLKVVEWTKIFVLFVLMAHLVSEYKEYRWIIWVFILCVGNWGRIAYEVGSNRDLGFYAPNATEENAISAHIVSILPFFAIYFLKGSKWQKIIIGLLTPFVLNVLILANSRASILAMGVVALGIVFLLKGKTRFYAIIGLIIGGFIFLQLTNEDFWERQQKTTRVVKEEKKEIRYYIYRGAIKMFKDYPFGVGGEGFVHLSQTYIPESTKPRSQHNTFLAFLTDWGFLGLTFYLLFLFSVFRITFKIKRRAKEWPEIENFYYDATALQLALLSLCVAGMFHSRQYAEVVYWFGALTLALDKIQRGLVAAFQSGVEKTVSSQDADENTEGIEVA
ncbi:MAG: hypothetical protein Kow0037_12520 [Calditrichia bacterium]